MGEPILGEHASHCDAESAQVMNVDAVSQTQVAQPSVVIGRFDAFEEDSQLVLGAGRSFVGWVSK
jgi:hypothetical protein